MDTAHIELIAFDTRTQTPTYLGALTTNELMMMRRALDSSKFHEEQAQEYGPVLSRNLDDAGD